MANRNPASKRTASRGNRSSGNRSSRDGSGDAFQQACREAAQRSRSALSGAGGTVVDTVKQHPVPTALMGAALTWMLLETRTARSAERKLLRRAKRAADTVAEPFSGVPRAARSAFSSSAEQSRDSVRQGARAVAGYARDSAGALGRTAQRGYLRGRETLSEQWDRHPLAMGVALLCAGLATGMLLPSSRREAETFGRASDDLSRRVKESSAEMLERGRELVESSRRAVERASRREGLSPATVGKKMRRVVKRAARAASDS